MAKGGRSRVCVCGGGVRFADVQGGPGALELKNRKRGRSTAMRRYLRKQINVVDERREKIKQRLAKEKADKVAGEQEARGRARAVFRLCFSLAHPPAEKEGKAGKRGALDRFSA